MTKIFSIRMNVCIAAHHTFYTFTIQRGRRRHIHITFLVFVWLETHTILFTQFLLPAYGVVVHFSFFSSSSSGTQVCGSERVFSRDRMYA